MTLQMARKTPTKPAFQASSSRVLKTSLLIFTRQSQGQAPDKQAKSLLQISFETAASASQFANPAFL